MIVDLALVVVGLGVLVVAADAFVVGAARCSRALGVPTVIVGAVVIGFGTSLPELLASVIASLRGDLDVSIGNVVGSNLANITLLLGVGALVTPLAVSSRVVRREAPLVVGSVVAFAVVAGLGAPAVGGALLAVGGVVVIAALVTEASRSSGDPLGEADEVAGPASVALSLGREVARTAIGLAGVVGAATALVDGAVGLADRAGLSGGFVGATLVGLGTSAPELVTVVQSARRGEPDLVIGNLLGSNLFNALIVGGVAIGVGPGDLDGLGVRVLGPVAVVAAAVVVWAALVTDRTVTRREGTALIVVYLACLPLLS